MVVGEGGRSTGVLLYFQAPEKYYVISLVDIVVFPMSSFVIICDTNISTRINSFAMHSG